MIPYILHISILVACSYIFYKLFLEGETFFQLNRWVLLGCALLAFVLPFLEVPQEWSLREADVIARKTVQEKEKPFVYDLQKPKEEKEAKQAPLKHLYEHDQNVANDFAIAKEELNSPVTVANSYNKMSLAEILMYVYLLGVGIFALNFLMQVFILFYKMLTLPTVKDGEFLIVELDKDKAPFSFWNRIFMNPASYDWDTYAQILQHEKIHVSERHTFDIILAELLVIIQWFNPFAWLYRKAVENNLEYLTDYKMLTKGTDRQAYQMNLLKITVPDLPLNLTTNYNQSFLKKRISMMNSKKSSISSGWKYLFIIPLLGLSIICLNAVKTVANEIDVRHNDQLEQMLAQEVEQVAEPSVDPPIVKVATPSVKIATPIVPSVEMQVTIPIVSVPNVEISMNNFGELSLSGKWTGSIEGNEVCISFKDKKESKHNNWRRSECFDKGAFSNIPIGSVADFELKREAGTLKLNGRFENNDGIGSYTFEENAAFRTFLEGKGYNDVSEEMMFHLALSDINKNYLSELKNMGFKVDGGDLEHLAHMGPSLDAIKKTNKELKSMGYTNVRLDDLMALDIHDVNMDYIKELRSLGFKDMTIEDIVGASIHEVTREYFRSLKAVGLDDLSMDEMIQFAIHDIQAEDVQALKNLGFRDMSTEDIVAAGIHDVTPEYLAELKAAGLGDMEMEELVQFAIHDVDAEDIQELRNLGFKDLSNEEIIMANIHDVAPEYLAELKAAGLGDMEMEELVQFAIHDVDAEDIQELRNLGFKDLSNEEIIMANIHDVDAKYIRSIHELGFKDASMEELVSCRIHDVDADFIKEVQASGKTGLTLEDYIALKIHSYGDRK